MDENANVIVASDDTELLALVCQQCEATGLSSVICPNGGEFAERFASHRPWLICIDSHLNMAPNWPLFQEIILHKHFRAVPMILVARTGQNLDFNFPQDQCVYVLSSGDRLSRSLAPVLEELTDIQVRRKEHPHSDDVGTHDLKPYSCAVSTVATMLGFALRRTFGNWSMH